MSTSLHQDGSQERPVSLTSTTSSSGSSRDSRSAMEEPSGSEAPAENGAGSPRDRHLPNSNNNSSSWLNVKGPLSPFNSRAAAGSAHHKLNYLGRVVREIVETERMYVQDLRSIVEVRAGGPVAQRSSGSLFHPGREALERPASHKVVGGLGSPTLADCMVKAVDPSGFLRTLGRISSLGWQE